MMEMHVNVRRRHCLCSLRQQRGLLREAQPVPGGKQNNPGDGCESIIKTGGQVKVPDEVKIGGGEAGLDEGLYVKPSTVVSMHSSEGVSQGPGALVLRASGTTRGTHSIATNSARVRASGGRCS